jgi:serine/threonine protein kinase
MINTLLYINSKGIAHRDIKLENMLVNKDYKLKFADFGFASFSKEKQT